MIISSSFIQALPELLTTLSSSSDFDFLLATQKTTNGFNLGSSALAVNHMLTIHFSCPIAFKQTNFEISHFHQIHFCKNISFWPYLAWDSYKCHKTGSLRKHLMEMNLDSVISQVGAQNVFKHLMCVGISHLKQGWPNYMINSLNLLKVEIWSLFPGKK